MTNAYNARADDGNEIRTGAPVARVLTREGAAYGVALADGTEFLAPRIASGVDAHVTFLQLVDPKELPGDFVADVRAIDYASANRIVSTSSRESMAAFVRNIARTRARTTAGCSGFTRNSSAPDAMPAISFSIP